MRILITAPTVDAHVEHAEENEVGNAAMPSVSPKQAKYMRAIAHGMKPTNGKGPGVAVAREFERADEAKSKGSRSKSQRADHKRELDKWAHGQRNTYAAPET
jgi:hypothetical protein